MKVDHRMFFFFLIVGGGLVAKLCPTLAIL